MLETGQIVLDLDRTRIKDILEEAYRGCSDLLSTDFEMSAEDFSSRIDIFLDSNRVTIPVTLSLPSRKYPDLRIEVDLRRKKVFGRLTSRSKQALINRFLKSL